jgi:hypothetical protein
MGHFGQQFAQRARRLGAALLTVAAVGAGAAACRPAVVQSACDGTLISSSPGSLSDSRLVEVSGIGASAKNPGTLWAHNDSGDSARLFAITEGGATRVVYTVTGAGAVDWEDLGIGPGPVAGESYLYAGDIGDNGRSRASVTVYRVVEPTVTGSGTQALAGVAALTLRYPDGPRDAEALFVDPTTGELYIISKSGSGGATGIYRAPANLAAGTTTTLTRVGTLNLPSGSSNAVTAADIANDGKSIAVRTYGAVRLWSRDDGQTVAAALTAAECRGPVPAESQGETVTFRPDNRAYYTVSEGGRAALHRFEAPPN